MRVTFRLPFFWTFLLAFFFAGVIACVVAWGVLLTTICSNPRAPIPQTQHVIPYNCHGMKVFISPWDDGLLHWLGPLGLLCMLLSAIAGAMVVRAVTRTWPSGALSTKAYRVRIVAVPSGEAPDWVREKWVGLELPLAQLFPASSLTLTAGVLSGPRSFLSGLGTFVRGGYRQRRGFKVNVLDAIAVLEGASPEAANWWRVNAPHMMTPSRFFLFPDDVCTIVE